MRHRSRNVFLAGTRRREEREGGSCGVDTRRLIRSFIGSKVVNVDLSSSITVAFSSEDIHTLLLSSFCEKGRVQGVWW
jgi:hypothetical protein